MTSKETPARISTSPAQAGRSLRSDGSAPLALAPRWLVTLAIGAALATAALWLLGTLGLRLGYGAALSIPALDDGSTGIVGAIAMLGALPDCILAAGLERPVLLLGGFGSLACPAACLAAVIALRVTAARPGRTSAPIAALGAVIACIGAALALWWLMSSARGALFVPLPAAANDLESWLTGVQVAAGVDVLLGVSVLLWCVLALVLHLPLWIRSIAGAATITALAMMFTGAAASLGVASGAVQQRPVLWSSADRSGDDAGSILLGTVGDERLTARSSGGAVLLRLEPPNSRSYVSGRHGLVEFLAAEDEGDASAPE